MEPTQPTSPQIPLQTPPKPSPSQNVQPRSKLPMIAIAVFVLGLLLYVMSAQNGTSVDPIYEDIGGNDNVPIADVSATPPVNGFLSAPSGFPSDIPIENSDIVESSTTSFPGQNFTQLSVNYRSTKSVAAKYAEYKSYMTSAGYSLQEGSATSPIRAIFGTKADANLSVAISTSGGKTLVQLSYLLK